MNRVDGPAPISPPATPARSPRDTLFAQASEITLVVDAADRVAAVAALDVAQRTLQAAGAVAPGDLATSLFPADLRELVARYLAAARDGAVRRTRLVPSPALPARHFELLCQPLVAAPGAVLLSLRGVPALARTATPLGISPDLLAADFEATLEQAGIGWFERDLVADVGTCSRSAAALFGYANLEVYDTQALLARTLPEDRARLESYFADVLRQRESDAATRVLRYRILHPERGVRHIEARLRNVFDNGEARVYGLVIDVTDIQALEERLSLAMREARLLPFEYDAVSGLLAGPSLLAEVWSLSLPVGPWPLESVLAAVHPEDRARLARLAAGDDGGDLASVEFRLERGEGHWYWQEARCTVDRDLHGRMLRIRGIIIDISARKAAELALREREERLRLSLAAADLNVWYLDLRTRRVLLEPHIARQLGFAQSAVTMDAFRDTVHPDDRATLDTAVAELLASRSGEPRQLEYRLRLPDGSELWADTRAGLACDDDGEPVGIRGVSVDISTRRQAEAERAALERQLAQAQRMEAIGMLTGGIAHDFNNIMASILGYTELARRRFARDDASRLAGYLREVRTAGERARDMIKQMLAFSRGESVAGAEAELELVVREATRLLRSVLPSSLELVLECAVDLPSTSVDGVKLQQVVMNLCINARDALGGRGHLWLRLTRWPPGGATCASCHHEFDGEFTCLSVIDDGPGFDAATAARVFEPFFTTKAVGQGSGMGLAMVHGLVHDHGGHVLLDSVPGGGTTVHVLLPCAARATRDAAPPGDAPVPGDGRGDVLVVDDEAAVGTYFAEVLDLAGFRATALSSGAAALERLRAEPGRWAALVTDLAMPEMSGVELVAAARALRPELAVVMVSGYGATLDAGQAGQLGVGALLAKPVAPAALVAALRRCLDAGAQGGAVPRA